jgi:iron complex transport system ATP-binding protein
MTVRLSARGVRVTYGKFVAIDGVDLDVRAGELLCLIGPNGSGKSTLLRALLGAERLASGTVWIDGRPLASLHPRTRARILTLVVLASPVDFQLRVRDLVALGRLPYEAAFEGHSSLDRDAIDSALRNANLFAMQQRTLDSLSTGELQRAHLARAIAQRTSILMLDEPTAYLDLVHQMATLRFVRQFVSRGGAAIIALHDLNLAARYADRLAVLQSGRLMAEGPPRGLLESEVIRSVFQVSVRRLRDDVDGVDHVVAVDLQTTTQGGSGE